MEPEPEEMTIQEIIQKQQEYKVNLKNQVVHLAEKMSISQLEELIQHIADKQGFLKTYLELEHENSL